MIIPGFSWARPGLGITEGWSLQLPRTGKDRKFIGFLIDTTESQGRTVTFPWK